MREKKKVILKQLKDCYTREANLSTNVSDGDDGGAECLRHFEIPSDISLSDSAFTAENGMMTQTNKLCRPAIRKKFAKQLETMLQAQQKALEEDELSQRYTEFAFCKSICLPEKTF